MSIAQEIRDAIHAARTASKTRPGDPFKQILDEVAEGLTDESVEAHFTSGPGGRWTLWLSPAYRPGRASPMMVVVISGSAAEVLLQPKRSAATPEELAEILKGFVTTPDFLETMEAIAKLASEPVEGFLRMAPQTVSRGDLMLEVSPENQREIATHVGEARLLSLRLRISDFPGAGTFKPGAGYKVLESAGFTVTLIGPVTQHPGGELRLSGSIARTVPS